MQVSVEVLEGLERRMTVQLPAKRIDAEVRAIIERNYECARKLIEENRDVLEAMAEGLVAHETLTSDQIDAIMAGRPIPEPAPSRDQGNDPRPPGTFDAEHPLPGYVVRDNDEVDC